MTRLFGLWAASVGMWAGWSFSLPASMLMKTTYDKVYTGEGAQLHLAQVIAVFLPLPASSVQLLRAIVLGWVTRAACRSWAVGLVALLVASWLRAVASCSGTFFAGSGWTLLFASSCSRPVCRRL